MPACTVTTCSTRCREPPIRWWSSKRSHQSWEHPGRLDSEARVFCLATWSFTPGRLHVLTLPEIKALAEILLIEYLKSASLIPRRRETRRHHRGGDQDSSRAMTSSATGCWATGPATQ